MGQRTREVRQAVNAEGPVLVSWVALHNDPYEREGGTYRQDTDGQRIPGPTLALLFDEESPYRHRIRDIVLLHRQRPGTPETDEQRIVAETVHAIRERMSGVSIRLEAWEWDDPTDHKAIFAFLREKMPELRRRYAGRPLVLHASPGTPSMQTVWVLMAETGFIEQPFELVKSYRKPDRNGRPAVVPVEVGIETFYKAYKASRPIQVASQEEAVFWDPARFQSPLLRALYREARRFAHLQVPVLILGERGTGKSTLAGWMRLHSPYRRDTQDGRWPAVACGQYSPETMRAELFGYRKGAFTGAEKDHQGLLAAADGDTLFLDEVGDVSRDLQRLLIKALEEKRYLRLGDTQPLESDFRLLTATNLEPHVLQERLDPDFLDRIGLLRLHLPPLRDVPEDLPWLWEAVYQQALRRSGADARQAKLGAAHHERIVRNLQRHPLPGNLRDIFRVAYRLLAARCDPLEPLPVEEGVAYALEGTEPPAHHTGTHLARAVARAFALSQPLDGLLQSGVRLSTEGLERELKLYMAHELRRVASERRVPIKELCDVTERTLLNWKGEKPSRKKSSDDSET